MVDAPGLPQDPLQVRLWPFLQLARRFEVNRITKPELHDLWRSWCVVTY